jgi:hypothetical protein
MDMAKRTAAAAVQAKKKKARNPPPSDEDEDELISRPPKKSKKKKAAEASSPSSEEENSSSSDDDEESRSIKSSHEQNELSRKEDAVEGEPKTKTNYATEDDDMSTDVGPWEFMLNDGHKGNATEVQRSIVPWLIGIYGLNYHKNVSLDVIKEMLLALCASNGWVSCPEAAKKYKVAFNDVATRVKAAAGMLFYILCLKNRIN